VLLRGKSASLVPDWARKCSRAGFSIAALARSATLVVEVAGGRERHAEGSDALPDLVFGDGRKASTLPDRRLQLVVDAVADSIFASVALAWMTAGISRDDDQCRSNAGTTA
jgi:hypothetical protein